MLSIRAGMRRPDRQRIAPSSIIRTTRSAASTGSCSTAPAACADTSCRSRHRRGRRRSPGQGQAEPLARPLGLEAGHHHEDQVAVEGANRPGHRQGEVRIRVGDVAQRPVGLHVPHRAAGLCASARRGADLVEHGLLDIGRALAVDRAPPEAPEIEEARMRPRLDAGPGGERQGLVHDQRVAGVEPAGDVGRAGDRQHPGIVAQAIDAKPSPMSQFRSTIIRVPRKRGGSAHSRVGPKRITKRLSVRAVARTGRRRANPETSTLSFRLAGRNGASIEWVPAQDILGPLDGLVVLAGIQRAGGAAAVVPLAEGEIAAIGVPEGDPGALGRCELGLPGRLRVLRAVVLVDDRQGLPVAALSFASAASSAWCRQVWVSGVEVASWHSLAEGWSARAPAHGSAHAQNAARIRIRPARGLGRIRTHLCLPGAKRAGSGERPGSHAGRKA